MGAESITSPAPADDKSQNPVSSEVGKSMDGDGQDAKGEASREATEKSIFVNSEPMREDQVQNAVKFLSHPKVRESPVIYRRSFLEKKGLTKEEIDEAFHRVPDPTPNATATPNQDGQLKSTTSSQPQVPTQTPRTAVVTTSGVSSLPTLPQSSFHWSHAFLAAGLLAASGVGTAVLFKKAVVPRLKSWICKVVLEKDHSEKTDNPKPTMAEEAAAAAKAAAVAAADVARASQELLNSKSEERKYLESFMSLLDVQVKEMKSMRDAIRKLEVTREVTHSPDKHTEDYIQSASANGPSNNILWRTPVPDRVGPRPSSMVTKPWDAGQVHDSFNYGFQSEVRDESSSDIQNNGYSQTNGKSLTSEGDHPEHWWRQKTVRITEIEPETDDQRAAASYGTIGTDDGPVHRQWVPPQPPSVAIPEAAAAIRQPKPFTRKEQSGNEQLKHSDDGNAETPGITRTTESEVEVENPDRVVDFVPSEGQEEQDDTIKVN
ncbi:hypothetical protein MRB53_018599 [Persea americana]|uniref:Uncharacterized protein n=1 Tax=Persea americana TaxID=3435 RepID=A0ACC2M8D1_PERAE|nr:hypothetical protein MRB53_018599 [Persea americana]